MKENDAVEVNITVHSNRNELARQNRPAITPVGDRDTGPDKVLRIRRTRWADSCSPPAMKSRPATARSLDGRGIESGDTRTLQVRLESLNLQIRVEPHTRGPWGPQGGRHPLPTRPAGGAGSESLFRPACSAQSRGPGQPPPAHHPNPGHQIGAFRPGTRRRAGPVRL